MVGNAVYANNSDDYLVILDGDESLYAGGNGILVAGGNSNVIERNLVVGHDKAGIAVLRTTNVVAPPRRCRRPETETACLAPARRLDSRW